MKVTPYPTARGLFFFKHTGIYTCNHPGKPRYQPHLSVPHSLPANTSLSVITEVRSKVGLLTSSPFIFKYKYEFA